MSNKVDTIDETLLNILSSMAEDLEAYGHIDSKNYLPQYKAAISAVVDEIIGPNPDYSDKQPKYVQRIEAQVIKVKNAQYTRAIALGLMGGDKK